MSERSNESLRLGAEGYLERTHARNAMVIARYSHCRRVFGRTPSKCGPPMQTAASNRNHVLADLNVSSGPSVVYDDESGIQVVNASPIYQLRRVQVCVAAGERIGRAPRSL
jgi:hypothetical protein